MIAQFFDTNQSEYLPRRQMRALEPHSTGTQHNTQHQFHLPSTLCLWFGLCLFLCLCLCLFLCLCTLSNNEAHTSEKQVGSVLIKPILLSLHVSLVASWLDCYSSNNRRMLRPDCIGERSWKGLVRLTLSNSCTFVLTLLFNPCGS